MQHRETNQEQFLFCISLQYFEVDDLYDCVLETMSRFSEVEAMIKVELYLLFMNVVRYLAAFLTQNWMAMDSVHWVSQSCTTRHGLQCSQLVGWGEKEYRWVVK
jgi:hypothetical protein